MKYKYYLFKTRGRIALFLALLSAIVYAKGPDDCKLQVMEANAIPDYNRISHVSIGPADSSFPVDGSPNGARGIFYRLVFFRDDYPSIRPRMRVEEFIYGDAGCCWTRRNSMDIDFNKLGKSGVQMPDPYMSAIGSVVWHDTHRAIVSYGDSQCTVSNIGRVNVLVKCEKK